LANAQIREGLNSVDATNKEVFIKLRSLRDNW
jgi:hydroxyacylglutathione hydrolase